MHIRSLFRTQILITGLLLFGISAAIAQTDIQPVFTPAITQKVDARSAPAKVTNDDENSLAGKGYVKLGTIIASHPGKKENPDITRQLEAAILQKSAAVGGDIVCFSKEGSYEEREVPTGKTKTQRTCLEERQRTVTTTNPGSCVATSAGPLCGPATFSSHQVTECVKSGETKEIPITKWEKGLVSEGTVWRYDPNWAADIARAADASLRVRGSSGINAIGSDGCTPLIRAIRNKDFEEAKALLNLGTDVNEPSEDIEYKGETPLISASLYLPKLVKSLVEHGANVNAASTNGDTALYWAACVADPEILTLLLSKGANVNMQNSISQTPLMNAASCPAPENVTVLLAYGADKNLKDYAGRTAADVAQKEMGKTKKNSEDRAKYQQIIQLLSYNPQLIVDTARSTETAEARPNAEAAETTEAAGTAEARRKEEAAEVKSHPAYALAINTRDNEGYTLLIRAIKNVKLEEAEALLEHGADVNEPLGESSGTTGVTPLMMAVYYLPGLVKSLVERGANVNATDSDGRTALYTAACRDDAEILKLMLAKGATVNNQDDLKETPLMSAVVCAKPENVEVLLDHGADVNIKNKYGDTPLLEAVTRNSREMAEPLLAHGADVNVTDAAGWTPLKWALSLSATKVNQALIDLLRQHGGHE